jgi:hypothetical protein
MLRALFLRELRRSWLAHAGLFAAIFGTATLLEYALKYGGPQNPGEQSLLSGWLLIGVAFSGLITGERCFSKAFKENRYPFLITLPSLRGRILFAYLGGRLAGATAALPVLLLRWLAAPSSAAIEIWPFLILALAVYLVYFLGGAALALTLRTEIQVYLLGFPLLTALLFFLAYSASYGFGLLGFLSIPRSYLLEVSIGSLMLTLMWAAVARRAFCRGEFQLGRRMAQTWAEAGIASIAFVVLIATAFSSTKLTALRDEWALPPPHEFWNPYKSFPYEADTLPVSADGKFLFIQQRLREHPRFTRIAVVNLQSGKMSRWMERPGIQQIYWSKAALNVLAINDAPLDCRSFPCEGSTSWYRLTPDLRVLSVSIFPGVGLLRRLGGEDLLLVIRQAKTGRVYRLSDGDGSFQKIIAAYSEYEPNVWSLGREAVVVFRDLSSTRAWWLDSQGRVLYKAMTRGSQEPFYLFRHQVLSQEMMAKVLLDAAGGPEQIKPFLPGESGPFDLGTGFYFLEDHQEKFTADLSRYAPLEKSWSRIQSGLNAGRLRSLLDSPPIIPMLPIPPFDLDFQTWTWVSAVKTEGRYGLFLYDDQLGRSVPTGVSCGPGEDGRAQLQRVQGLSGLLIRFTCLEKEDPKRHWFLQTVPGSGWVQYLPAQSAVPPDLFDRWIYLGTDGTSVWISTTGEVWQAGPGGQRRRLNPPGGP